MALSMDSTAPSLIMSNVYVTSPDCAGWLWKRGFRWRKLWVVVQFSTSDILVFIVWR